MPAKHTIERILRDDDDASGQSIRDWKIEAEVGHGFVMIRMNHGDGFILLRASDVQVFAADLATAATIATSKNGEVNG